MSVKRSSRLLQYIECFVYTYISSSFGAALHIGSGAPRDNISSILCCTLLMIELGLQNGSSRYLKLGEELLDSNDILLIQCDCEADAASIARNGCHPLAVLSAHCIPAERTCTVLHIKILAATILQRSFFFF